VIVCTPGGMHEFIDQVDWFYYEIRWWLDKHSDIAPVLVTSDQFGIRYIPDIIKARWPIAQLVSVDHRALNSPQSPELSFSIDASIQSILGAIAISAGDNHIGLSPDPWRRIGMYNQPGLYTWEKDRAFHYINVNENYARSAGYDSPEAMIGKKDEDMPWSSLVDLFRAGDQQVMSGVENARVLVQEKEIMVDRVADILVSESALYDKRGEIIGLTGCYWDITGRQLIPRANTAKGYDTGIFPLGKDFGDIYFTEVEVKVFRALVRNLNEERIATLINISRSSVESHIDSIKRKLQCYTKGDIVVTAARSGLPLELFGPIVGNKK
jgi:DNA-binding CsgD family transcriptional regulator/PAS domain-containing protein